VIACIAVYTIVSNARAWTSGAIPYIGVMAELDMMLTAEWHYPRGSIRFKSALYELCRCYVTRAWR